MSSSPSAETAAAGSRSGFAVRVAGFEGPFDLLLALIAKHRIELTALALHVVTDDFIAHVRAQGDDWDLDEATEFLVVAATLLDLKAARLLPDGSVEDEADVALLEARDLLFARLLQYRAFKEVSQQFAEMISQAARMRPRDVPLEPWAAALLPDVELGLTPQQFAALAAAALAPKPDPPGVGVEHVHAPAVSVREQAAIIVARLRRRQIANFGWLVADAGQTLVVVARFLALLELYRSALITLEQAQPYQDLQVRWVGGSQDPQPDRLAGPAGPDEVVEAQ